MWIVPWKLEKCVRILYHVPLPIKKHPCYTMIKHPNGQATIKQPVDVNEPLSLATPVNRLVLGPEREAMHGLTKANRATTTNEYSTRQ